MKDIPVGLCWGTIHHANLTEMIELAGRHGFPTISVPPHLYFASLDAGLTDRALRRLLADAGVRVTVIDAIQKGLPDMPPEPTEFDGHVIPKFDVETCCRVADALEASIINVSHFPVGPAPVERMAEAIGPMCRKAAEQGMRIVLEFVPNTGIGDLGRAFAIAQGCGEPNCAILLDTWHLARTGGTASDIEALPTGTIGAFQLCDRIEPPSGQAYVPMTGRSLPGEGELPLGEIIAAALANNPAITIELEVFSEELREMPLDAAAARVASAVEVWKESLAAG
ncbi:MAG: TIM barrel protein [Novosphingobium sp.]|nr:sugar phosphate isomerase/epimerase [Novosphingobium sp.]